MWTGWPAAVKHVLVSKFALSPQSLPAGLHWRAGMPSRYDLPPCATNLFPLPVQGQSVESGSDGARMYGKRWDRYRLKYGRHNIKQQKGNTPGLVQVVGRIRGADLIYWSL